MPELPPEWVSLGGSDLSSLDEDGKSEPPQHVPLSTMGNTVALKRLAGLARHLAATPKGGRHQALYTIARTLGGLVASGHLTHAEIHSALYAAAEVNGLLAEDREHNITQTIADGITKGISDGPDPGHHETGERNPYTLTPGEDGSFISEARKHLLDIDAVIEAEIDDTTQWLIEPIIPAHKSVALYAAGKTGKSLLALDIVAAAASGRPILGGAPLEAPIHILYVDQEMTENDLTERLHSLGYTQRDPTLKQHFHYSQLYPWPPLDTKPGGDELLDLALDVGAQLVVLDTLIRTVSGEENSADTIKDFYRHTGMALKKAGIALLRIDHAGKDLTRGQRGTSAKNDDVDVIWLLKEAPGSLPDKTMLNLVSTSRVKWIQEDIHITRNEGQPLTHVVPTVLELTSADIEIVNYLQDQGLWRHNITYRNAREVINHSTLAASNNRLIHVAKWMKRYGDTPSEAGEHGGERGKSPRGERAGERETEKGNAQVSEGEHQGNATEIENQGKGSIAPPLGGGLAPPRQFRRRERASDPVVNTHQSPLLAAELPARKMVAAPPAINAKYRNAKYHTFSHRNARVGRVTDCGKEVMPWWGIYLEERSWTAEQLCRACRGLARG